MGLNVLGKLQQKSAFVHRRAFCVDHTDIEHPKKEMNAIKDTGSKYVFMFLPGEAGVCTWKFFCSVCEGCRKGLWRTATDPMRGKVMND